MFTFAPNISWLLPEIPFEKRADVIAKNGFKAIEFGFPSHADLGALQQAREKWGLTIVLFNLDVPVWDRSNRGYLVDPSRRDEFKKYLDNALEIARQLGVLKIMLSAGVGLENLEWEAQQHCMIENLQYAAPLAEQVNVLLTIEALNPIDNPGYFLNTSKDGLHIVQMVNHPRVRFQFDTYHIQMMEGQLETILQENMAYIGHIQFADYPGRHEPGTGNINFDHLTDVIQQAGYSDYIGLEYLPTQKEIKTFDWIPQSMRG